MTETSAFAAFAGVFFGTFLLVAVGRRLAAAYRSLCEPYEPEHQDNTHCRFCDRPWPTPYPGAEHTHCDKCCEEIAASTFIPDYYDHQEA